MSSCGHVMGMRCGWPKDEAGPRRGGGDEGGSEGLRGMVVNLMSSEGRSEWTERISERISEDI